MKLYYQEKNKKLITFDVIYKYLEKPKYRALVLFPPYIILTVGLIIGFIVGYPNYDIVMSPFVQHMVFGGTILLILCVFFILWCDYITDKNKMKCKNTLQSK
jgi:uncharacterized membrane protein